MAYGLKIRNSDGTLRLDVTYCLFRVLGQIDVPGVAGNAAASGAASLPSDIDLSRVLWFVAPTTQLTSYGFMPPEISISGRTVTWTYSLAIGYWWSAINGRYGSDRYGYYLGGCRIYYGTR